MGSWGSEGGGGKGGGGIGPIVWVRRRNGSWWPGKILLEPEELSECNLTSPRTGTPVKLLGREDASVDWYNLEKSKRVKAFRCGEFDDCIEKAESAQGMPIKKREKYARREDAILHALELEKKLLGEQTRLGVTTDSLGTKLSESGKKELASFHHGLSNNSKNFRFAKSDSNSRGDTNFQVEMDGSPNHSPGTKYHQHPWEDDHSKARPRMRELQDLGLKTTTFKRKYSSSDFDIFGRDNHFRPPFGSVPTLERMSSFNGGEPMGANIFQAKRSRCIYFPTGSTDLFDDKEHSLGQIRMSAQFEGIDYNPHSGLVKEDNSSSEIMEVVGSDYSEPDSSELESESESDSSETEPDTDKDMTIFSESERNGQPHHEVPGDHESTSSEEPDESAFSDDIAQLYAGDPYLSSEAVSKWSSKGKRNLQYFAREYVHGVNGEYLSRPSHAMDHGMKASTSGQRAHTVDGAYLGRKYVGTPLVGLDNGGFPCPSRFSSKDQNNTTSNSIDWEDMIWENRPLPKGGRGPWDDGRLYFGPGFFGRQNFGGMTRSLLVDVDLKVQSNSGRDRTPFVSLLSKLNGRAIIGHPIQIEALKDGSSESLVISKDAYSGNEPVMRDGNPTLAPSWKTARRTNFRVPRPHISSVFGGDDSGKFSFLTEQKRTLPLGKQTPSSIGQNASFVRKSLPHKPWPLMDRKNLKKPSKKVTLSSNQKTRTLSSIGFQHNFGTKTVHDTRNSQMDGLIKTETSGPTTVACIPVKLVFSRLLEKINRPASRAVSKSVV